MSPLTATRRTVAARSALLAAGSAALAWLPSCGEHPKKATAMVFAAASLAASFEDLATAFAADHPDQDIALHCDGTPRLVLQLREGAPADVFASADEVQMQRVVDAGQTAAEPTTFASNRLAIVTAKDNPKGIRGLADLARPDVTVLLCGPDVPAGRYARIAFGKAGVAVRTASDEPNVSAVVTKIRLGQADAGVVYATDGARAADQVHTVPIADEHNVVGRYPIALLSTGRQRVCGEAFVAFVHSEAGQRILAAHGFTSP